eukprot:TRINITY_DN9535_c0_g1_i3.p1 TRINITY_DN9535_c0_g1~~TRINITY_DN9535_c0_g1_i3.p1  ORF type:complete len:504 (+),score=104.30 TRINITY_DN9535_c0_g1_i3:619-2130(+)
MGAKVAATCLHSSQPVVSHSSSLSQKALSSSALSPSSSSSNSYSFSRRSRRGRSVSDRAAAAALRRFVRSPPHPPLFFGINLPRSRSCEFSSYSYSRSSRSQSLWRSCSSRGSDAFFDEEFAGSLRETTDDGDAELDNASSSNPKSSSSIDGIEGKDGFPMMYNRNHNSDFPHNSNNNLRLSSSSNNSYINSPSSRRAFGSEAVAGGAEEGEMISASVEHKANSVDFPLSLRMLKRKKKQQQEWEEGEGLFGESSASASSSAAAGAGSCSVKKAFSSMVFMIRELHTYTLHMREMVFPHHQLGMGMGMGMDLQGVLARVRKEMHASFVWLFQHIFSSTPTLMVYVMILLANFTVYSMTATAAIAPPPRPTMEATTAASESHHHHHHQQQQQGGSGMRAIFLEGSGSKRESVGTGVFLPRRVGSSTELRRKPACSTVLVPARVVQALNLNLDEMGSAQPRFQGASMTPRSNSNALLSQQMLCIEPHRPSTATNYEVRLPQEWTY